MLEKVKIFVKPPIRRDETGGEPPYVDFNVGFRSSSSDESPTQRSLEGRFSGLIDLRERVPANLWANRSLLE